MGRGTLDLVFKVNPKAAQVLMQQSFSALIVYMDDILKALPTVGPDPLKKLALREPSL